MGQSSGTAFFRSFSDTLARAFRWPRASTAAAPAKISTVERIRTAKTVLSAPRRWLSELPWERVQGLNHSQCQLQNTQPTPNRGSYDAVRQLWEAAHGQPMSLVKALDLCKESHDKAPFVFSNGRTFCLVANAMLEDLVKSLPPVEGHIVRTTAANYVSGRVRKRELLQILRIYESKWSLLSDLSRNGHIEMRSDV
jgi:hypothetical protein